MAVREALRASFMATHFDNSLRKVLFQFAFAYLIFVHRRNLKRMTRFKVICMTHFDSENLIMSSTSLASR